MLPQLLRDEEGIISEFRHTVDTGNEAKLLVHLHLVRLNAVIKQSLLRADGLFLFRYILNDCRQIHLQA